MGGSRIFVAAWIAALSLTICASAPAARTITRSGLLGAEDAQMGANALAEKLTRLQDTLEMREGKLTPNAPSGTIDRDSGNPSQAATTMHTYVRSVCLEWLNPLRCNDWLDPFTPIHGQNGQGDYSPAEGLVAAEWQARRNIDGDGQYRLWEIRRLGDGGGSNRDAEGKLDLSGVVQYSLIDEVGDRLRGLGKETGARAMLASYDQNSGQGRNIMPNRPALSAIAATFTKQFRNRLASNLGQMRAARAPGEYLLSEEIPDCDAYRAAVRASTARNRGWQEKLPYQARLKPQSMASLDSRYQACVEAQQASVQAPNPQGGGDPESEPIDEALTRLNIAAIDRAGVNVTELPKPSYVQLTERQITSEFVDFEEGGLTLRGIKRETNATTLNSYNNNIEIAAQSMQNVLLRNPTLRDNSETIRGFKIEPGTKSAVEINGLTGDMKRELASTQFAANPLMTTPVEAPPMLQEDKPSELTITRR